MKLWDKDSPKELAWMAGFTVAIFVIGEVIVRVFHLFNK